MNSGGRKPNRIVFTGVKGTEMFLKQKTQKTGEKILKHCVRHGSLSHGKISIWIKLYSHRDSFHGRTRQLLLQTSQTSYQRDLDSEKKSWQFDYFIKWLLIVYSASITNNPKFIVAVNSKYGGNPIHMSWRKACERDKTNNCLAFS